MKKFEGFVEGANLERFQALVKKVIE